MVTYLILLTDSTESCHMEIGSTIFSILAKSKTAHFVFPVRGIPKSRHFHFR